MEYPKITTGRIMDDSEFYEAVIKALQSIKDYQPKISFEIRHKENKNDIRSFRTASLVKIEDLIKSLVQAYAFMKTDKGLFGDGFDKIDKANLDAKVRDELQHLYKKLEQSMFDGIRQYMEINPKEE